MPTPLVAPPAFDAALQVGKLQELAAQRRAAYNNAEAAAGAARLKSDTDMATTMLNRAPELADTFGGQTVAGALSNYVNKPSVIGLQPTSFGGPMTTALDDLRLRTGEAQISELNARHLPAGPKAGTNRYLVEMDVDDPATGTTKRNQVWLNADEFMDLTNDERIDFNTRRNIRLLKIEPLTSLPSLSAPGGVRLSAMNAPGGGGVQSDGGQASADAKYVYEGLVKRGMAPHIAAGMAANINQESSFNPAAFNENEQAYGLIQARDERRDNLHRMFGRNPNVDQQLDFIMWELGGPEAAAWRRIEQATTAQEAAALIDQFYERSSGAHRNARVATAQTYYDAFGNAQTDAAPKMELPEGWIDNGDGTVTGPEGGLYRV